MNNDKKIVLEIKGLGEIVSFKNSKMITRGRLITAPRKQKQMEAITKLLKSQLLSLLATTETEMVTERIQLSKIALSVPLDDALAWVPEHCVKLRRVSRGQEGAEIVIELMENPALG